MANIVLMPSLSPTMEDGVIAKWYVAPGDKIEEGTVLCSVETDKTTVDYESLDEGILRLIDPEAEAGNTVRVNQVIAVLTDEADEEYEEEYQEAKANSASSAATEAPTEEAPSTPAPSAAPAPAAAPAPVFTAPVAPTPVAQATAAPLNSGERVKATPVARKMALAQGYNLAEIPGSGPGGRILKEDVERFVPSAKAPAGARAAKPSPADLPVSYGSMAPVPATQDIPISGMQKTVGARLLQAQSQAPEFFVSMKIGVDKLNKLRKELNAVPGYKISVNDLVLKGVAMNLRRFPVVNSSLHGDIIRQNGNIDISVAVSIPGGLITPIVKDADRKPLGIISAEVKSLVGKAKAGTLAPEEFQGGTFTISNMGMFGVSQFTSIINPPQSAILAIAGVEEVLFRKEDGEIGSRHEMTVTLTSDHRVINGADAAAFVGGLKEILENPACMML